MVIANTDKIRYAAIFFFICVVSLSDVHHLINVYLVVSISFSN